LRWDGRLGQAQKESGRGVIGERETSADEAYGGPTGCPSRIRLTRKGALRGRASLLDDGLQTSPHEWTERGGVSCDGLGCDWMDGAMGCVLVRQREWDKAGRRVTYRHEPAHKGGRVKELTKEELLDWVGAQLGCITGRLRSMRARGKEERQEGAEACCGLGPFWVDMLFFLSFLFVYLLLGQTAKWVGPC